MSIITNAHKGKVYLFLGLIYIWLNTEFLVLLNAESSVDCATETAKQSIYGINNLNCSVT